MLVSFLLLVRTSLTGWTLSNMEGIGAAVKLSWDLFFGQDRAEGSLGLARVTGEVNEAARQ